MNRSKLIGLANTIERPAVVAAFYDRYQEQITGIKTVSQRNLILSDMQENFEMEARQQPKDRNQLSIIYELLKQKCFEVV